MSWVAEVVTSAEVTPEVRDILGLVVAPILLIGGYIVLVYSIRRQRRLGTVPKRVAGVRVAFLLTFVVILALWGGSLLFFR